MDRAATLIWLLDAYGRRWSDRESPLRFRLSGDGALRSLEFPISHGLDVIALACLHLCVAHRVELRRPDVVAALAGACEALERGQAGYRASHPPYSHWGEFRAFPLLACKAALGDADCLPYDVLSHSLSEVRLYGFKTSWLCHWLCSRERALPHLFKNIADTLGYVEEAIGLLYRILGCSKEAVFLEASRYRAEPSYGDQFERRIQTLSKQGYLFTMFGSRFLGLEVEVRQVVGLVGTGLVGVDALMSALDHAGQAGVRLEESLVSLGFLAEETSVFEAVSRYLGVPFLSRLPVDADLVRLIPEFLSRGYGCVPVSLSEGTLTLAMANPQDSWAISDVGLITGLAVAPVLASEVAIEHALNSLYPED